MRSSKLIIALDFDNEGDALHLVDQLDPTQCALKVGSEMFTLLGMRFVSSLIARQFHVFLDLKFYDIPNTVARACKIAADAGVWMLTLHSSGGLSMMRAAKNSMESYGQEAPKLVAVTLLTSFNEADLSELGIHLPLQEQVRLLACLAKQAGLDGVVSSALEVPTIKAACGQDFLTVTPGIRLKENASDDQSRIVTPEMAKTLGCDYWVVGRPITRAKNIKQALINFKAN